MGLGIGHGVELSLQTGLHVAVNVELDGGLTQARGQIHLGIIGIEGRGKSAEVQCLDHQRCRRCTRGRAQHQSGTAFDLGLCGLPGLERNRAQTVRSLHTQDVVGGRHYPQSAGGDDGIAAHHSLGLAGQRQVHAFACASQLGTRLGIQDQRTARFHNAIDAHTGGQAARHVNPRDLVQAGLSTQEITALPLQGLALCQADVLGLNHQAAGTQVQVLQQHLVHARSSAQPHQLRGCSKNQVVYVLPAELVLTVCRR